jgi:hypothetical protein
LAGFIMRRFLTHRLRDTSKSKNTFFLGDNEIFHLNCDS